MTTARHAVAVPHPHLEHTFYLAEDLCDFVVAARLWLVRHVYGAVITLMASAFVAGVSVSLALEQAQLPAILVAMVGIPVVAGAVAYHVGGAT